MVVSTPSEFVDALGKEDIKWPVKYDDEFPYSVSDFDNWSAYFTSRQLFKKFTKDSSALMNAQLKMYAQRAIQESSTHSEIDQMLKNKKELLQQMSVFLHHDAISGTARQYVNNDYTNRMLI